MQKKLQECKRLWRELIVKRKQLVLEIRAKRRELRDVNLQIKQVRAEISHMKGADIDWKL